MLFDPSRHEPLAGDAWDPQCAWSTIERIVRDAEAICRPDGCWPVHPKDLGPGDDPTQPSTTLYYGAAGVIWALRYLRRVAVAAPGSSAGSDPAGTSALDRLAILAHDRPESGSYLCGVLPVEMMRWEDRAEDATDERIATLIDAGIDHPARELMWGAPGSLLAAAFLHEHSGNARWADAFRLIAGRLRQQLRWSDEYRCDYWTQDLYGHRSTYLGAVHGFVATAHGLIRGSHLLPRHEWGDWRWRIVNTVARTASREGRLANWRPELFDAHDRQRKMLMQYCHGAPGFVICLGRFPGDELDELLSAAGETIWTAGPLAKGSNLCHGTAGNGYSFLKLFERTGDEQWLRRARAFAMHAIKQSEDDAARYGQLRHSLWTGDLGLAVYLWDCLRAKAEFPTLDVFFPQEVITQPAPS